MRTDKEILLDLINLVEEHNQNTIQRETANNDNTFGIPNSFIDKANSLVVQEDQLDILQEECAELIQACSKVMRDKPKAFDSLKEEMSHVLMSAAMVAKILGITQADIDLEVKKKADKFVSPLYKCEKKVDRTSLFEKYKERARKAYDIMDIGVDIVHIHSNQVINYFNSSNDKCRIKIEFKALGTISNPSVVNIGTNEFVKIKKDMIAGEVITVDKDFTVTSTVNGITTNILNCLDIDSSFLQLYTGNNLLKYDASIGIDNLEVTIWGY